MIALLLGLKRFRTARRRHCVTVAAGIAAMALSGSGVRRRDHRTRAGAGLTPPGLALVGGWLARRITL
jgi:hypothetical protein